MARTPRSSRPGFSESYGVSAADEGLLPWSFATERLAAARNYWVGTVCADGRPSVTPVWGVWVDDEFRFGASPRSLKARNLARDPRVVVHLESGDEAVILEGTVERTPVEQRHADEFERKYDWRPDSPEEEAASAWYRFQPAVAYAWLERDYTQTATRFDF